MNTLSVYKQGDPPGYYVADGTFAGISYPVVSITENNRMDLIVNTGDNRNICRLDYNRGELVYRGASGAFAAILADIKTKCGLSWITTSGRTPMVIAQSDVLGRIVPV